MIKLGYRPQEYRKCLYFDGHERPDVVESRKKYIEDFSSYRKRSRVYGGDDLEAAVQVDPEALGDGKETVFIFHDESTVHAKEKPKSSWLLPGSREIRSKNSGRLIHISDFILETTGRLKLPEERARALNLESNDAATVIYPGSNGGTWNNFAIKSPTRPFQFLKASTQTPRRSLFLTVHRHTVHFQKQL
jgi:hypothetical protein